MNIPPSVMPYLDILVIGVQAATQAIYAAIIEEKYVLRGDENGFRDREGNFVSKPKAYVRAFLGVGMIAASLLILPRIFSEIFVNNLVQITGTGIIGSIILVHQIAKDWCVCRKDYAAFVLGLTLIFAPYGWITALVPVIAGMGIFIISKFGFVTPIPKNSK